MTRKCISVFSLNGNYFVATLVYLGLALMFGSLLPDVVSPLQANGTGCPEITCSPGTHCCQGQCIPDSHVCCDDGTSGPDVNDAEKQCGCCSVCNEELCDHANPPLSTYVCES
jgi:hypothetical protein